MNTTVGNIGARNFGIGNPAVGNIGAKKIGARNSVLRT